MLILKTWTACLTMWKARTNRCVARLVYAYTLWVCHCSRCATSHFFLPIKDVCVSGILIVGLSFSFSFVFFKSKENYAGLHTTFGTYQATLSHSSRARRSTVWLLSLSAIVYLRCPSPTSRFPVYLFPCFFPFSIVFVFGALFPFSFFFLK